MLFDEKELAMDEHYMFKMSWGKNTGRNFKQTIRTTKRTKGCHVVLAVNGAVFGPLRVN